MKAKSNSLQVKCPSCGELFSPELAIEHSIRERLEKDAEAKLNERLKAIQNRELDIRERERKVTDAKEAIDLEVRARMLEKEEAIRKEADLRAEKKVALTLQEKERRFADDRATLEQQLNARVLAREEQVRQEERMRLAEVEMKLKGTEKLVEEMTRKMHQGSMQTQGEVQEIAIEEYLELTFPQDTVGEIAKGKRGADCVHEVKNSFGNSCGKVLYESKRTKNFSNDWIVKMKEDMRLQNAEIGVIVTQTFPADMARFGERDGVWICTLTEFKALAILFRQQLLRLGELTASQENRGEKEKMIYDYVTSLDFRQKIEAAFQSYAELQRDLMREKTIFANHWAKREKSGLRAMENIVALYGDLRGIAGGAVHEIPVLEMPEVDNLPNA